VQVNLHVLRGTYYTSHLQQLRQLLIGGRLAPQQEQALDMEALAHYAPAAIL
jgi:hypothetical protein